MGLPWDHPDADPVADILAAFDKAKKSLGEPIIGSPENPFRLYVSPDYEARCVAEGTTPQRVADKLWPNLTVKVETVKAYQ